MQDTEKQLPSEVDPRCWACKPRSQKAVDIMFSDPPMLREIGIAEKNGYIIGKKWIPPERRKVR